MTQKLGRATAWAVLAVVAMDGAAAAEDVTARLFEAARQLESSGQADQARTNYLQIVETAPESAWADDALLALAHLAWPVDTVDALGQGPAPAPAALAEARARLDALVGRYVGADRADEGSWRLALLLAEPRYDGFNPNDAAARLIALPTVYPRSPRAPLALAFASSLDLEAGRHERAVTSAFAMLAAWPGHAAAPRAWLTLSAAHAKAGRLDEALAALGRAHTSAVEGSREAGESMRLATLVDRVASRLPNDGWRLDLEGGLTLPERALALAAQEDGTVLAALEREGGIAEVAPDGKSAGRRGINGVTALAVDAWRRVWAIAGNRVIAPEGAGTFPLGEDVRPSAIAASSRDVWVADERGRRVLRVAPGGTVIANVAMPDRGEPSRVLALRGGGAWVIDARNRRALLLDAAGALAKRIDLAGAATAISDAAVDRLGHLYLLDGREGRVVVITADGAPIARLALPREGEPAIERPELLAVDGGGRIAVYDGRRKRLTWLR